MINIFGRSARAYAVAAGIIGTCALCAAAAMSPESAILKWPGLSRSEARVMIAKYGQPASFDDNSLVWRMNGPWLETVVYRQASRSLIGYHGKEILKQTIAYVVPSNRIAALKRFDGRLQFDQANGRLSSTSENEDRNFLALNLADEIVAGKRTAEEARLFYRKTVRLAASGKSSAYLDGFLFPLIDESMRIPSEEPSPGEEPGPGEEPYRSGMPQPRQ
jgi:hypothetical protein